MENPGVAVRGAHLAPVSTWGAPFGAFQGFPPTPSRSGRAPHRLELFPMRYLQASRLRKWRSVSNSEVVLYKTAEASPGYSRLIILLDYYRTSSGCIFGRQQISEKHRSHCAEYYSLHPIRI